MVDKNGKYNLTPKGRESLRAHIKALKLHRFTRGPSTPEGKARSRFNGMKHGRYSRTVKLQRYCGWLKRRYYAAQDNAQAAQLKAQLIAKLEELREWQESLGEVPAPAIRKLEARPGRPIQVHQDNIDWGQWVTVDVAARAIGCSRGHLLRVASGQLVHQGKAICANRAFPFGGMAKWHIHVSVDACLANVNKLQSSIKRPVKRSKPRPFNRTCPIENRRGGSAKAG